MNRLKAVALLILLLSGCATQVTSIKDGQTQLAKAKGYLLLSVETNRDLKTIYINGPQNISLGSKDIRAGSNYILVELEAGSYTFERIQLDRYWYMKLDEEYWQVTIEQGKINYIGHLELVRPRYWSGVSRVELVNRSSEALEYLEESYPVVLSNYPITNSGPGEDDFFDIAASLKKD
ncbi:hypothetical protein [Pleionea sediminis]|uniref:hypothetical protein n=1 Tax=Pleionea sediminis TaxID=2569479 RepID=UPI001186866E|nr:hypothetical protein [Pleionea sediminis]